MGPEGVRRKKLGSWRDKSRRVTRMKPIRMLLAVLIFGVAALGQGTRNAAAASAPQAQPLTVAAVVDREIGNVEKQVLDVAEAMPEEKFNFTPESLNIPGGDYKGVRMFAGQVKHIAASNYFIWSAL